MCLIFFRKKVQRWRQRTPGPNGLLVRPMRMAFGHAILIHLIPLRLPRPPKAQNKCRGARQKSAAAPSYRTELISQLERCVGLSSHDSLAHDMEARVYSLSLTHTHTYAHTRGEVSPRLSRE